MSTIKLPLLLWLGLISPILILALGYDSLPSEIPLLRSLTGGVSIEAPRSMFSVFRIPAIALLMGGAIEVMRHHTRRLPDTGLCRDYERLWNIFLATLAAKTIMQAVEFHALGFNPAGATPDWAFPATIIIVIAGLVALAFPASSIYQKSRFRFEPLTRAEKFILSALGGLYLIVAVLPVVIAGFQP